MKHTTSTITGKRFVNEQQSMKQKMSNRMKESTGNWINLELYADINTWSMTKKQNGW